MHVLTTVERYIVRTQWNKLINLCYYWESKVISYANQFSWYFLCSSFSRIELEAFNSCLLGSQFDFFLAPVVSLWKFTSFSSPFTVFPLKNVNQHQLVIFSEPLAQSQSDWRAFRPEPAIKIKNLQFKCYYVDFFFVESFHLWSILLFLIR
jgi:hypothetical protein